MTLLSSVASIYQKLRDLPPASISTGLSDQTIVGFLNEAAGDVLNCYAWSFLKRYDGQVFFPGPFTTTAGGAITDGFFGGNLNVAGVNAWDSTAVQEYTATLAVESRLVARIVFSGETSSYRISQLFTSANFPVSLLNAFRGTTYTNQGWTIFTYEHVLPDTVRQVLSVYDQDRELKLCLEDRDLDLIARQPRDSAQFGDPDSVFVGGTAVSTTNDLGSASTTGLGFMVYPPPDSDKTLKYSYIYRYPALSADSDSWAGVPSEVVSLIEWFAYEKALDSNVEDDPDRAAKIRAKNEAVLDRLKSADSRMVYRRHVPREIGRRRDTRNPRARWSSQVIPPP